MGKTHQEPDLLSINANLDSGYAPTKATEESYFHHPVEKLLINTPQSKMPKKCELDRTNST
jgi:hypothetical protein